MRRPSTPLAALGAALLIIAGTALAQLGIISRSGPPSRQAILFGGESVLSDAEWSELGYVIVVRVDLAPRTADAGRLPESLLFFPLMNGSSFGGLNRVDYSRIVRSPDLGEQALFFDTGYQGNSAVGAARLPAGRYPGLRLEYAVRGRSRNQMVNEPRALEVPWPSAPWSNELALCLEPQLLVESDAPEIRALVDGWTNSNPRRANPYHLAKHLAAQVLAHMRDVSSENLRAEGLAVSGALEAARTGRGTGLDLAALLCAVYRAAGIPARLVVCADVPNGVLTSTVRARAVVEFFLPPEADASRPAPGEAVTAGDGLWIPVDIQAQREFSSRPLPFEQPWPFFGNSDRLETLVPLAFHFHPPVESARVGAPALWSWTPGPASGDWSQAFSLTLNEAALPPSPEDMQRLRGRSSRPAR